MANTLLTDQKLTFKALYILQNSLKGAGKINRGYDDQFAKKGAKIGATLNVRKPQRYIGRTGQAVNLEALSDTVTPLTITTQFGVDFEFSSSELALSLDDFSDRYLKPAMAAIANKIDVDVLQTMALNTANFVGVAATVPNALLTYLQAGQKLDEMAAADDNERSIIMTPAMRVTIVNALTGLFQDAAQISRQYKEGMMGRSAGFDWYQDQNCYTHTIGTFAGTPLVNTGSQTGSSLITDGWTAGDTLNQGDVFTIGTITTTGTASVNPQSRQSTGSLQAFVCTATQTADAGGNMTIPIYPAITPSGQYQNVDQSPADNAVLNIWQGTVSPSAKVTPQGLAFHRDCFSLAMAELDLPDGVDMKFQKRDPASGVVLRFVRQYVATSDQWISRFDVLYGVGGLYPETCCRIAS